MTRANPVAARANSPVRSAVHASSYEASSAERPAGAGGVGTTAGISGRGSRRDAASTGTPEAAVARWGGEATALGRRGVGDGADSETATGASMRGRIPDGAAGDGGAGRGRSTEAAATAACHDCPVPSVA